MSAVGKSRDAALAAARQAIAKQHGSGTIISLDGVSVEDIETISTGAFLLDRALGIGGFPRGRLAELFGEQGSGKTSLALASAAQAQRDGGTVLYLDYEHAFDRTYASLFGIDFGENAFILSQPESLEQGMKVVEYYIDKSLVDLVIIDSLAAMVTQKELAGELDATNVAPQAKAMGQILRRFTKKIAESMAVVLFINHVRTPIGLDKRKKTPGGDALKFYASVRVEVQQVQSVKGKVPDLITGKMVDGPVALRIKATTVKNKCAAPYRIGYFHLRVGYGLYEPQTILEVAEGRGLVRRNGGRYILPFHVEEGKDRKVNIGGLDNVFTYFDDHPDKYTKLKEKVIDLVEGPPSNAPAVITEPAKAVDMPLESPEV